MKSEQSVARDDRKEFREEEARLPKDQNGFHSRIVRRR